MVDVHVALRGDEDETLVRRCFDSINTQGVNLHVIDSVPGSIKRMRAAGFSVGGGEYVSYADPDDLVLPGTFSELVKALEHHPDACGAYGLSNMSHEDGRCQGLIHPYRKYTPKYLGQHVLEIHQPVVMRRAHVLQTLAEYDHIIPDMGYVEVTLFALMSLTSSWVAVDHVGYEWTVRQNGAHHHSVDRPKQLTVLRELHAQLSKL